MKLIEIQDFFKKHEEHIETFIRCGCETPKRLRDVWIGFGEGPWIDELNETNQKINEMAFFKENEDVHFITLRKKVDFMVLSEELKHKQSDNHRKAQVKI